MALTIQDSVSVAANTTNDDVLSGKRNALIDAIGGGASVAIYATGSATGLMMQAFVGQRNAIERSAVNVQNRIPVTPDDLVASQIPGLPGERVTMPVENTTAGALTFFYRVLVEELPRR